MTQREFAWIDYANVPGLLDWVAFLLGIIGFIIALCQIRGAKSGLKIAEAALISTRNSLISRQLLAALPRLEPLQQEVLTSAKAGDADALAVSLHAFAFSAQELSVLLRDSDPVVHKAIANKLAAVATTATVAQSDLYLTQTPMNVIAGKALTDINSVAIEVVALLTKLKNDPGSKSA